MQRSSVLRSRHFARPPQNQPGYSQQQESGRAPGYQLVSHHTGKQVRVQQVDLLRESITPVGLAQNLTGVRIDVELLARVCFRRIETQEDTDTSAIRENNPRKAITRNLWVLRA